MLWLVSFSFDANTVEAGCETGMAVTAGVDAATASTRRSALRTCGTGEDGASTGVSFRRCGPGDKGLVLGVLATWTGKLGAGEETRVVDGFAATLAAFDSAMPE